MNGQWLANRQIRVSLAAKRGPGAAGGGGPAGGGGQQAGGARACPACRSYSSLAMNVPSFNPLDPSKPSQSPNPTRTPTKQKTGALDHDPTNTTLFLGGLAGGVNENELRSIFGRYGALFRPAPLARPPTPAVSLCHPRPVLFRL